MGGGCWKLRDEKAQTQRAQFFFRLKGLSCLFLFFLLLRFMIAWSERDFGVREDPRDRFQPLILSPFDVQQLSLLPGLGPQKAREIRRWALKRWAETRGAGELVGARPKGVGDEHWRRIRLWLDLSSLRNTEAGRAFKSSRE